MNMNENEENKNENEDYVSSYSYLLAMINLLIYRLPKSNQESFRKRFEDGDWASCYEYLVKLRMKAKLKEKIE